MSHNGGVQPTKEMACGECGSPMTVNAQTVNAPRCYECGLQAFTDQVTQMHQQRGPYYEAWLKTAGPRGRPAKGKGHPLPSLRKR
jgi:hypothetical protein